MLSVFYSDDTLFSLSFVVLSTPMQLSVDTVLVYSSVYTVQ